MILTGNGFLKGNDDLFGAGRVAIKGIFELQQSVELLQNRTDIGLQERNLPFLLIINFSFEVLQPGLQVQEAGWPVLFQKEPGRIEIIGSQIPALTGE